MASHTEQEDIEAGQQQAALERNIALYPWYQAATGMLPWLPVFFLYFLQLLPLEQVVQLSAIYYLAVVICEVPSGYISDRYGRRVTLLLSVVFLLLAYGLFIVAAGFNGLVVAEIFLAAGIAFQSGSDTALHYDSLHRLGRESEYTKREAKAAQFSLAASAIGCVIGGFSGSYDLVFPYYLSVLAAAIALVLCLRLVEPESIDSRSALGFMQQITQCARYALTPVLMWILCFYVAAYCLQHVIYEFYQPYIRLLEAATAQAEALSQTIQAPLISGLVLGLSMLIGVLGARLGITWLKRLGLAKLLLAALVFQTAVVAIMGLVLHPVVLVLVVARNFSMAMVRGPMLGAIGPLVKSAQRATYLSMQSLFARLAFSISLFLLSLLLQVEAELDWTGLSQLLLISAGAGLCCFLLLWFSAACTKKVEHKL